MRYTLLLCIAPVLIFASFALEPILIKDPRETGHV